MIFPGYTVYPGSSMEGSCPNWGNFPIPQCKGQGILMCIAFFATQGSECIAQVVILLSSCDAILNISFMSASV